MNQISTLAIIVGILTSAIRLATPYLYATIGETIGQLSGVLNLGVEGMMLLGAYAGFYATFRSGNPWLGVLAAIAVGLALGLVNAFISVTLKAEQGISGIGMYLFGLGMSELLFRVSLGTVETVRGFAPIRLPVVGSIPVLGDLLFNHNAMVYGAYLLVPLAWFVLHRTTWGLKIRAAGQNPAAADSLGVSITAVRYATVTLGGVLSAVAGASLSIALLNVFQQNLTSGMGFIAVALVYFGGWRPAGALVGSLLFSTVNALQSWVQVLGLPIPPDFALMLPYVLTILALVLSVRKVRTPAALTKPFERGEG